MEIEGEIEAIAMEIERQIEAAFAIEDDCEEGLERQQINDLVMEEVLPLVGEVSENKQNSTKLQIMNIVRYFRVGCPLDLRHIALGAWNVEYNPKKFTAAIMRIKRPPTTALIFPKGKLIVTGAKNEHDAELACRKYIRILQKMGYPVEYLDPRVINMVGLLQMPFMIDLIMLNAGHYACTKWEPELFPGLLYMMPEPKVTILVFQSGKVLFLGFTERKVMLRAYELIHPVLIRYKKKLLRGQKQYFPSM